MSNILQRRWAKVLELAVVAVAVTVLTMSVGSLQAQEQDRPSAQLHTQPVFVSAGYTAQLAFVNLATRPVRSILLSLISSAESRSARAAPSTWRPRPDSPMSSPLALRPSGRNHRDDSF